MSKTTGINKLIEKCRRGDEKACQEVRDFRKWIESIYNSVLIFTLCTVIGQAFVYLVKPMVIHFTAYIFMIITIIVCIIILRHLEKFITKLYQVITDPIMNFWPMRVLYLTALAISIAILIMTILGI